MVIGVNWMLRPLGLAQNLIRSVGDDFVHVHVCLRAGTSLININGKLIHEPVLSDELIQSLHNCVR